MSHQIGAGIPFAIVCSRPLLTSFPPANPAAVPQEHTWPRKVPALLKVEAPQLELQRPGVWKERIEETRELPLAHPVALAIPKGTTCWTWTWFGVRSSC